MSTMVKTFLWLLAILLVLAFLVAVGVQRLMADPQPVARYASKQLGREVTIGGLSDLRLGREVSILVEDLAIANPAWAEEPELLRLRRLRLHLELPSLWSSGPVVLSDLEVDGLQANLLAPEGREPSWALGGAEAEDTPGDGPLQLPVYLRQAHISDSGLHYRDPDRDITATLAGQLEGGDGIALQLEGDAGGHPVDFSGRLRREQQALELSAAGTVEGWTVGAEGSLADPLSFRGLDIALDLEGNLPVAEARTLPAILELHIDGSGEHLKLRRGELRTGKTSLSLRGDLGNLNSLEGLALELALRSPDLRELLQVPANDHPAVLDLSARVRSEGRSLRLENIVGETRDGRLRGEGLVALAEPEFAGSRLKLHAAGETLSELLKPWFTEVPADSAYDIDLVAEWRPPYIELASLDVQAGLNSLNGKLRLGVGAGAAPVSGDIRLTGKRAYRVLRALGVDSPLPDDSYLLTARLDGERPGEYRASDLEIRLGQSRISGEARVVSGEPVQIEADLVAAKLDLRFLVPEVAEEEPADAASDSSRYADNSPLSTAQLSERVLPDAPLELGWLRDYQGRVALQFREIVYHEELTGRGGLQLSLADGALVTENFHWQGDFSTGEARLELRETPAGASLNLLVDTDRLPLLWVASGNVDPEAKAKYQLVLAGEGASVAGLAGSLSGSLAFRGEGGRVRKSAAGLFLGDLFGELAARIDPEGQSEPYTDIECFAGMLRVDDGLVDLTPGVVARSERIDLALGGTVDLGDEQLNLVFNSRSRKGLGISASKMVTPFIKLSGNFAHPRIGVNPKGVAVSGALAVATGGMSILAEGMWDRWIATSVDPCEALFDSANTGQEELKKLFGRP